MDQGAHQSVIRLSLDDELVEAPGLDPLGRRDFKDMINRISREEGKTVFFCSHVLSDAEQICDMVGIISKGRLLVMDEVENLLKVEGETLEDFFIRIVSESERRE